MTSERWQRVKGVFESALEREPGERAAFLDQVCDSDESLRKEVESLLNSFTDSFMETPAVALEALADEREKLKAGETIGHYKILSSLGAGGMGEVYLAQDMKLGRKVALKLLPTYLSTDGDRLRRFEQEARAASTLSHANVCVVHEVGEAEGGRHYIVMEYVEGVTLRDHMAEARMKMSEVLDAAVQIATALTAAHKAGIVHRDIKPENVILRPDGYLKVLDFGLAKLTERPAFVSDSEAATRAHVKTSPGMVMGTVQYMSPEQARGAEVDARTDLWSLGVMLYEMVTGRVPFEGETPSHMIVSLMESEPPPLARYSEVSAELERIVGKALRKKKEERYQTAADLALDLKSLKEELEMEARLKRSLDPAASSGEATKNGDRKTVGVAIKSTAATQGSLSERIRSHKSLAAFALAALLIGVIGLGYYFLFAKTSALSADGKITIAVLPLKPIKAENRDSIYELGIAESLILKLSTTKNLVVRPLSATRKYSDIEQDPTAAGREQQVDFVLSSNYQVADGRIRVTSQLINVQTGQIEETFKSEKDSVNVFLMQDAIANELGNVLLARFGSTANMNTAKRGTTNEEAYRLYLQGMYLIDKRNLAEARKGVEILEQAVKLDPNYAAAWAGKAHAHRSVASFGRSVDIHEEYRKSIEAINKALALDVNLADAHSALCENKMNYEWDFEGAERECKRAIELDPNSSLAYQIYARSLNGRGRFDEAIAEIKTAIDLEPTSLFSQRMYGDCLRYARRYEEAIAQYKRVIAMDKNFGTTYPWLSNTLELQGNQAEAFEWWMKFLALQKADEETVQIFKTAFQTSGWQGILRERVKRFDKSDEAYFHGAANNAQVGNKDKAFEYLEKSYQRRELWMVYLQVDPRFDSLRGDPRFDELVRLVGSK